MGAVCEGMRLTVCTLKRHFCKEPGSYEYQPVGFGGQSGEVRVSSKALDPEASSSDVEAWPSLEMATSVGDTLPYRFTCTLAIYHIFCAALVLVSLRSGWVVAAGGASFAWELWAVWQHACLWMLFCQSVLRCKRSDADGLERKTLVKVLLYTMPGCSELADTMKDWILCGICVVAAPTAEGLLYGLEYVALDLLLRLCPAPSVFPFAITRNFSIWSPAFCLLALPCPGLALVLLAYPGFAGSVFFWYYSFELLIIIAPYSGRLDLTDDFDSTFRMSVAFLCPSCDRGMMEDFCS